MAGAITEDAFLALSAEDQIAHLKSEADILESNVATIVEEPGKTIMQKISGFIQVFLVYTINFYSTVKQLITTSNDLIVKGDKLRGDLDVLGGKHSTLSDAWDMRETSIRNLEALKVDEFKNEVNQSFAILEGRLGQGGATIISDVQALCGQLDILSINVGTAISQLLQLRQDVKD